MKAAQLTDYKGPGSLVINEVPQPQASDGEVIVEVFASAINPFDVKLTTGFYKEYIKLELPATLGGDVAGKVSSIGAGVEGFEVGQEVYGSAGAAGGKGAFAEFTPVQAGQLAPKPASLDFVQAAALPLTATSAYQALVETINLQPGQKILVHGGAGGIGSIAIQLAKQLGAYVATTVSSEETDFVKSLGADETIDYKTEDFSKKLSGYDAVFDTVGGETNLKSYEILKQGGWLVSMLEPPKEDLVKQKAINYNQQNSRATSERLAKITELVEIGAIKANVDQTYPLDKAAEAMEHLLKGHPRGKVIIKIK